MRLDEVPLPQNYDLPLVALSVVIALLASGVALDFAGRVIATRGRSRTEWLVGGALAMGFGIWSMHDTGMAGMRLPAMMRWTPWLVAASAAIASSIVDRRFSAQTQKLHAALAEVKTLRGMLPICAHCKRIRTDQGAWEPIEVHVRRNTESVFSHGMCPECAQEWEHASLT